MTQQSRPKLSTIYETVKDWHNNSGGVNYVVHAITAGTPPVARQLSSPLLGENPNAGPSNHPDQKYWAYPGSGVLHVEIQNVITQAGGVNNILRLEIDCSLMPCMNTPSSCIFQVPRIINRYGFVNVPLRIYSHRDEGMGTASQSTKRVILCRSGDNQATLTQAFNANTDWSWAPWNGTYP